MFHSAAFRLPVATRHNDDGALSVGTLQPSFSGFLIVVAQKGGRRALIVRNSRHEYRFVEAR